MSQPSLQAQIEAAQAYEELMVTGLFRPWAAIVSDAARIQPGERVLDVACGTGVLAREAADRTGPTGAVTGVDPSPGMLEVAKHRAPKLEWRNGFAEALPFGDGSFDAVVSQFGLMFFKDRQAALHEVCRVLVPDGRFAIAVWDSMDKIPAYAAERELIDRIAGRKAAEALNPPFALGAKDDLAALFRAADAAAVEIATRRATARFPSIRVLVEADLRGWLPVVGIVLSEEEIDQILFEAEAALRPYVKQDTGITFEVSAHVVTGTSP